MSDIAKLANTKSIILITLDASKGCTSQFSERIAMLRLWWSNCDQETVAAFIKQMDYREFLRTPYWKTIAEMKRLDAGLKCSLCASTGLLHVHHNTYNHHGYEIDVWKTDLICLCAGCHSRFHSKTKEGL